MARKQESMGYKEKQRDFCSFILVERRQWSEQKVANSYSMSGKDSQARLFPVMANDRTVDTSCRVWMRPYSEGGKCCIRKDTQVLAASPSLEILKMWLDKPTADLV